MVSLRFSLLVFCCAIVANASLLQSLQGCPENEEIAKSPIFEQDCFKPLRIVRNGCACSSLKEFARHEGKCIHLSLCPDQKTMRLNNYFD